jgi:hypothetical protein
VREELKRHEIFKKEKVTVSACIGAAVEERHLQKEENF